MGEDHVDSVRSVEARDLDMLLAWRNHPRVREAMFDTHLISRLEHLAWFERASRQPDRCLLVFEAEGKPSGFAHFHFPTAGVPEWGFYAAPDAPRGMGRRLGTAALEHAFRVLSLPRVTARVRTDNPASLGFHRALGFLELAPTEIIASKAASGVVQFELSAERWLARGAGVMPSGPA